MKHLKVLSTLFFCCVLFSKTVSAGWQPIASPGSITNIEQQAYTQFNAPKDSWSFSARWMGANIIGAPTTFNPPTSLQIPKPAYWQLGSNYSNTNQTVIQGKGITGGAYINANDSPHSQYNKHIAWSIKYSNPVPLWQEQGEELMLQAEVAVPTFIAYNMIEHCQCAGDGIDVPVGQVYFALNLDDGQGEDVQVTVVLFDSRPGYLYEVAHTDKFGRPFAMTYIGGIKYSTVKATGGYSSNTLWQDRIPFRIHITQDDMLQIIRDINIKRGEIGAYLLTEDVSAYSLRTFGLLVEVSYSEGDNVELGASWYNVSAYKWLP